jgi:hypothetical protein
MAQIGLVEKTKRSQVHGKIYETSTVKAVRFIGSEKHGFASRVAPKFPLVHHQIPHYNMAILGGCKTKTSTKVQL